MSLTVNVKAQRLAVNRLEVHFDGLDVAQPFAFDDETGVLVEGVRVRPVSAGNGSVDHWPRLRQQSCLLRNLHSTPFLERKLTERRLWRRIRDSESVVDTSSFGLFSRMPSGICVLSYYLSDTGTTVVTGFA